MQHLKLKRTPEEMKENYDAAFAEIIDVEKGYVNNPDDPGGETKYGVCKRQYPDEDIPNMTLERAKFLFKRDYWDVCKCDELPSPLDLFVFDAAINQGCDEKANFATQKLLQKTLGVAQDGILGRDTMSKARNAGKGTCAHFMANRALRYTGTRNADKFLFGWFTRLFNISMGK